MKPILGFGKYRDNTIEEIIKFDPYYISWCAYNVQFFHLTDEQIVAMHDSVAEKEAYKFVVQQSMGGKYPYNDEELFDREKSRNIITVRGMSSIIITYVSGKTNEISI